MTAPGAPGWTSTLDAPEAARILRAASTVSVLTHSKPDGDAVGSSLALARALRLAGVDATPVYAGPWVHAFDDIIADTPVIHTGVEGVKRGDLGDPDLVAIVDTGSWSQITEAREFVAARAERTIVIDHHLQGDPDIAPRRLLDTRAAAACEILAPVCAAILDTTVAALPREVAEPLYLGVATDTGWFRHSNVTPRTMRVAADLLEAGVRHAALFQIIEQRDRVARLFLLGRALHGVELHADNRVAIMTLSHDDFKAAGAGPEDTGGISDKPLVVESVLVSALLTAHDPGRTKISLRSKTGPDGRPSLDVNEVARVFGGGGHAQAAGARIEAPIDEARSRLLKALLEALR
jgi:phosphoesterase RecJ-like protein